MSPLIIVAIVAVLLIVLLGIWYVVSTQQAQAAADAQQAADHAAAAAADAKAASDAAARQAVESKAAADAATAKAVADAKAAADAAAAKAVADQAAAAAAAANAAAVANAPYAAQYPCTISGVTVRDPWKKINPNDWLCYAPAGQPCCNVVPSGCMADFRYYDANEMRGWIAPCAP